MNKIKRYLPYIIVFIASMGIMIIELVAGRLVSKYFGNSLYTWTGVIGVVLGGISLGNFLGGKLADRFIPEKVIGILLVISSMLTFLILVLDMILGRVMTGADLHGVTGTMVIRSFTAIVLLFFLPSASLGTISPVMAKYALNNSSRVGNTVGSIYALSAVGSIIGTFLSGYILIPMLGIRTIVFIVGGAIALLAVSMGRYRVLSLLWVGLIPVLFFSVGEPGYSGGKVLYKGDTRYSHIAVKEIRRGGRDVRMLLMDGLIHNMYDAEKPDDLLYEYEEIFNALTGQFISSNGSDFRSLTLGGGGCVLPSFLARQYPESWNEVVEIDPEVIEIAGTHFDLSPTVKTVIADARNYVASAQSGEKFDLIYLDAFNSYSVPYHLTTREVTEDISSLLEPRGMFMANLVDILSEGGFLNAYTQTVRTVFPNVAVYTTGNTPHDRRSTFVVAASFGNIGREELRNGSGRVVARKLPAETLADLEMRRGSMVLTDDFAPVENLIAPVFLKSVN